MFEWKEAYGCQIEAIDVQHRRLFELAAELYEITKLQDGFDHYDDISRIFQALSDYTVYHFTYEEELLALHGFPEEALRAHKWEHAAFVAKLLQIQQQDLDEAQDKVLRDIIIVAVDWIEKHILDTDMEYVAFLRERGVH